MATLLIIDCRDWVMSSSKAFYNSKFYAEWIYLFHLHSVCIVVEIAKLNHPHLTRGPDVALLEVPFVLGGGQVHCTHLCEHQQHLRGRLGDSPY